jgi:phosphate transport system permease protein
MSPVPRDALAAPAAHGPSLRRRAWDVAFRVACTVTAGVVLVPLAFIVWHLVARGAAGLHPGFFLHLPKPVGEPGGGMANAIVGTLELVGLGALIATPIGVGAGVFLAEFHESPLAGPIRMTADVLAGVPSIVVGVAAYGLVVLPMGRFSALAGAVALAILMLPTLVRSTEEVVRLVPQSYRQGALALGAPRWKVIQDVVLPAAAPAIVTTALLAVARAAGETAPLLFTALGNRFWSTAIDRPIASLPVMIYDYARSPYEDWNRQAWTGALVLLLLVTIVSALLRVSTRRAVKG